MQRLQRFRPAWRQNRCGQQLAAARGAGHSDASPTPRRGACEVAAPRPLRGALLDIDGTLVDNGVAIPGAVAALERLRSGIPGLRFVTNQTQSSGASALANLRAAGFHADDAEFFGVLSAARRLVDERGLRPKLLLSGSALEDFAGVPTNDPNAVIVGTSPEHLHYEGLNEAVRILMESEDSQLIALNKGRYYRRSDGFALMAGPFVAALEFATSRAATLVGKPSPDFFLAAVRDLVRGEQAVDLSRFVMVGDDFNDDVAGSMDTGMEAILLRTGKYRQGDEDRMPRPPLFVADDIAHAVDFLTAQGFLQPQLPPELSPGELRPAFF